MSEKEIMLFAFYHIPKIIMEFHCGYFPVHAPTRLRRVYDARIPLCKNPLGALKSAALIK